MVMRKVLSATPGKRNTRAAASFKSIFAVLNAVNSRSKVATLRVILGGFPSNTDNSISTGLLSKWLSATVK